MLEWLVLGAIFAMAFVNGANDVSRGIATLVGSGITRYKPALLWGSLWTAAGGAFAIVASGALVHTFAHGFVNAEFSPSVPMAVAVTLGACGWVALATRTGLPVSTTHAIVGSLIGIGIAAYGIGNILWDTVLMKIALPLLLSPFVALGFTWTLAMFMRPLLGEKRELCLCIGVREVAAPTVSPGGSHSAASQAITAPEALVASKEDCIRYVPTFLRLDLNAMHWLSSGATSFARGMNDAPKMAALSAPLWLVGSGAVEHSLASVFLGIALAMGLGSFLAGLRVTTVLAEHVTTMTPGEGFAANLCTSLLVGFASPLGLPVSTTHVSSMAIVGIGIRRGVESVRWRKVGEIALAWLITLPAAGLIGVAAWWLILGLI